MLRKAIAVVLALSVPASAAAGPLKEAVEKSGRDLAAQTQQSPSHGRGRFWASIALMGGGGALAALGGLELGGSEDEGGTGDSDDAAGSETGKDSDAWSKAMLGGGIAAAALGSVLLFTGRKKSGPAVLVGPKGLAIRHTVRF